MKNMKTFSVEGVDLKNHESETMTRLDIISKYCGHGSTFFLKREPENEYDQNAIQVRQKFKSGASVLLGYVPKDKAAEFAPLIDSGWEPKLQFGRKFIDEKSGDCRGMQIRYEVR